MPKTLEVKIPDIGDFDEVAVIEVMVKPGDIVKAEDGLITLESDKATMDVPSPAAGQIKEVKVQVGDKVKEGSLIVVLDAEAATEAKDNKRSQAEMKTTPKPDTTPAKQSTQPLAAPVHGAAAFLSDPPPRPGQGEEANAPPPVVLMPGPAEMVAAAVGGHRSHATPSVRRYARELGVDVANVKGSGPKGRILKEDVQAFVKGIMTGARPAAGVLDLPPWPKVDFTKFGPFETQPLSRIKKLSGGYLARNWVMIPHVTQFDEADITDLEKLRVALNPTLEKDGVKLTVLAFLVKASVMALKKFPEVNSSLDGDNLIIKHYYHIGFAADTPNGLLVPVIRDADKKGLLDIAREAAALAKKAREGKLAPGEMQGGSFTISSLGGIGGTLFTPIINAPEVAILGVSRAEMKPKWDGKRFSPRLMLPLSLSYDHRVVDGAAGARFVTYLGEVLAQMHETVRTELQSTSKKSAAAKPATKRAKAKRAGKKKSRRR